MNLITVAVVTMCVGVVYGQSSSCFTPDGISGACIPISECEPLATLANKPKKTDPDLMLLRQSHCGFRENVPQVCCPKLLESEPVYGINGPCYTPDDRSGTCVSLNSCPHIRNMLRPPVAEETLDFVKKIKDDQNGQNSTKKIKDYDESILNIAVGLVQNKNISSYDAEKQFGGNATSIDDYPWTVIIEYIRLQDSATVLSCSGALISGKYVLTAAHCIAGRILTTRTPKIVRLGEYDIMNEGKDCVTATGGGEDCTDGVIRIAIEKTIPHPKYNPGTSTVSKRDDIGLIRLKETAPYTEFIRPVCLPAKDLTQPENTPPYFSMYAVGWGETLTGSHSNVKQHVNLPFISLEKCQPIYNITGRMVTLWRRQLCAGGIEHQDTCKGDSGGPLLYENLNTFEAIGIVSFGPSLCGENGVPGIYTNVYEYLDWIKSVIVP